jgi:hypothetical protein
MTYSNYDDLKTAALSGHDMEVTAFLDDCTVLEGDDLREAAIVSLILKKKIKNNI